VSFQVLLGGHSFHSLATSPLYLPNIR
jgi:hypothetical protein